MILWLLICSESSRWRSGSWRRWRCSALRLFSTLLSAALCSTSTCCASARFSCSWLFHKPFSIITARFSCSWLLHKPFSITARCSRVPGSSTNPFPSPQGSHVPGSSTNPSPSSLQGSRVPGSSANPSPSSLHTLFLPRHRLRPLLNGTASSGQLWFRSFSLVFLVFDYGRYIKLPWGRLSWFVSAFERTLK